MTCNIDYVSSIKGCKQLFWVKSVCYSLKFCIIDWNILVCVILMNFYGLLSTTIVYNVYFFKFRSKQNCILL